MTTKTTANRTPSASSAPAASAARPHFPKRAVVTAGMPYGNKGLHFGHIGGVFVPADVFARFLRDRIGAHNVLFVCGTDCFGSPIDEGYRKLVKEGGFKGDIADYVRCNHDAQVATLRRYDISLDIYEGSGLGKAKATHEDFTAFIIRRLFDNGHLHKVATAQFFDEEAESFLNGRQVTGRCPVPGCKSEHAYADECDLGHQYMPADLIAPISALSGKPPVMRAVANWYFDLPAFRAMLKDHVAQLAAKDETRSVVSTTIDEFLVPPIIYVKTEFEAEYERVKYSLPFHSFRPAEKGKASFELEFPSLVARDSARTCLDGAGVRYRTGKTLVPFRITGNIDWGVPAPALGVVAETGVQVFEEANIETAQPATETTDKLTVWCWPESLWAPISFCKTHLENSGAGIETLNPGRPPTDSDAAGWEDWWCSDEATVYQFIGQDNIYFYGVAQTALWTALSPEGAGSGGEDSDCSKVKGSSDTPAAPYPTLRQSHLVANYHLLFLDKKASSSGEIKPPMADELLDFYTAQQLRAHFLALGLGLKPVSFQPKPLNPKSGDKDADPVLKEGALLTNVFNRLARSCFYTAQKDNSGLLPLGTPDEALVKDGNACIIEYERLMHKQEFHAVMQLMAEFIRKANKYWSDAISAAGEDRPAREVILRNAFYLLRVCTVLMHPIVPEGTRMIFDYLNFTAKEQEFFSWEHIFDGYLPFISPEDKRQGGHPLKELPPRTDFFARHESQG